MNGNYKIYIRLKEDKSLSMWADDEEKIDLSYTVPCLQRNGNYGCYTTLSKTSCLFTIEYDFKDVTSKSTVLYKVKGTMLLERNQYQIPDEDQQIEW